MKAIIVDDEPLMIRKFLRLSEGIEDLKITGQFESAAKALEFAAIQPPDVAFLDVAMPVIDGIETARQLREIRADIIIVFISAYDDFLWEFNQISGDYYIIKPYDRETLEMVMEKIRLLTKRQQKELYINTFGRFMVLRNGKPIKMNGKAKEILALIVTRRGKEISNEEIYSTIWENRPYSNTDMVVYYNALRRLKQLLKKENLEDLLISTQRGQMINVEMFDCDYYAWQDKDMSSRDRFEGEFMSEYSWGEYILADIYKDFEE